MIGTATNRPTIPNRLPTTTTPIAISAGCRRVVRDITSGMITLLSICCTSTYTISTASALPGRVREREQHRRDRAHDRAEVGHHHQQRGQDGEQDREVEPDDREPDVEQRARDEHVEHDALHPADPGRPQPLHHVPRVAPPRGRHQPQRPSTSGCGPHRHEVGGDQHHDQRAEHAGDAEPDRRDRADQPLRLVGVALQEVLDAVADLARAVARDVADRLLEVVDDRRARRPRTRSPGR